MKEARPSNNGTVPRPIVANRDLVSHLEAQKDMSAQLSQLDTTRLLIAEKSENTAYELESVLRDAGIATKLNISDDLSQITQVWQPPIIIWRLFMKVWAIWKKPYLYKKKRYLF